MNLNSIHSWASGTIVVVVFNKAPGIRAWGLKTSGDHAPARETKDPAETVKDPKGETPVLGVVVIDGIELKLA